MLPLAAHKHHAHIGHDGQVGDRLGDQSVEEASEVVVVEADSLSGEGLFIDARRR